MSPAKSGSEKFVMDSIPYTTETTKITNAHRTTVNAVFIERCKVSVVLISTNSASVLLFFAPLLCSLILSYNTIVSLIEYPIIVKVTATNASFTGILKIPKINNTMRIS